jgi:hypothetical protein
MEFWPSTSKKDNELSVICKAVALGTTLSTPHAVLLEGSHLHSMLSFHQCDLLGRLFTGLLVLCDLQPDI